jgi:hypothetical protein
MFFFFDYKEFSNSMTVTAMESSYIQHKFPRLLTQNDAHKETLHEYSLLPPPFPKEID